MSGLNRSVFCLACGEIIAEADLATHSSTYPNHAFIRYHHNLPQGSPDDPIGAIISGSLEGGTRVHVDGSRTDLETTPGAGDGTPQSGTAAQPFKKIQDAVDFITGTLVGPATLNIEQALYLESVVMPDWVCIDSPAGAVLRAPPGGNDALTVIGTYGDPEPAYGATVVRGLRIASDGDDGGGGYAESWCIRVVGDASGPDPREPLVVPHVCAIDAFNEGSYLFSEGGGFFLAGVGGMGGDDTGHTGIRLKPAPGLGCMCMAGTAIIPCGYYALEIYERSFFVGNGCRFSTNGSSSAPTKTLIKMDASVDFSLVNIYQPSAMFGDPDVFIDAVGPGAGGGPPGALITMHGGYNDIFDGVKGDAVNLRDGVLLRFVDGGFRSSGGRGIVVDDASLWTRNANIVSGNGLAIEISGDNSNVDCMDTTLDAFVGGPGSPTPGPCAKVDVLTPSVRFNGGSLEGAGTVLEVVRGGVWLIGGVDIDPASPGDVAYDVAAGAALKLGHCNVRRGTRVMAGAEELLHSGFGELEVGSYNSRARISSLMGLPGGGEGYEPGSVIIRPGDPFGMYQNINTEVSPTWKPIANGLMTGTGNPAGVVTGYAGLIYRDTDTDNFYICTAESSTSWQPLGGGGTGGAGLSKILQLVDTTGGMTITNVLQTVPFDFESMKDDYYAHSTSVNPGEVEILQTGLYKISAMLCIHTVSNTKGIRGNPHLHIEIDTGGGWVTQPDHMGGYIREDGVRNLSCSITGIGFFPFTAGDKLRLGCEDSVMNEPDEETVPYSSRLLIEYVDRSGKGSAFIRERLQMSGSPRINLNSVTEASPLVVPFASSVDDDPPFNFLGAGIFVVAEAGLYSLSYNLPFETDNVLPLQGISVGACYQWSDDSGSSWHDILATKSWDTTSGSEHDEGTTNLPPVEIQLEAGLWLRVVAWEDLFVCDAYINRVDGLDRAWARIERGHIVYDYVPANPSDWDAPPPTTEADALDRLAAKLAIPSYVSGVGDPRVVPVIGYAGQIYKDTAAGIYYVCEADGTSQWGVL